MTWLHLTIPALWAAAVWASYRASVCYGAAGGALEGPGKRVAFTAWLHGQGYRALTLFCAGCGGFVWGRLL